MTVGLRRLLSGTAFLAVLLLAGCGGRGGQGVEIDAVAYDAVGGKLAVNVHVVDPNTGQRIVDIDPEAFSVVVEDQHVRPVAVKSGNFYRLRDIPVAAQSNVPPFDVEVLSHGQMLAGTYLSPLWSARFLYNAILLSMLGLIAALLAKLSYFGIRRWARLKRIVASIGATPSARGAVAGAPAAASSDIVVKLVSERGSRKPIECFISTTSLIGGEDRNYQLPYIEVRGEGLESRHVEIILEGPRAFVRSLAASGIKLNGSPIPTNTPIGLSDGAELMLGLVHFRVTLTRAGALTTVE